MRTARQLRYDLFPSTRRPLPYDPLSLPRRYTKLRERVDSAVQTEKPFEVEYEISQPKFVDWSKKNVRIPAILPLPGLPDAPAAAQIEAKKPLELGTPLTIELEAAIELPAGTTAQAPIGTTVNRDYATFTSKYSAHGNTLHASRSLQFISSELPSSRAADFNVFLHAVQADQNQLFTTQPPPQK